MRDIILRNIVWNMNMLIRGVMIFIVTLILFRIILKIIIFEKFKSKYTGKIKLGIILIIVITYVSSLIFIWNKDRVDKTEIVNSYKLEKTEDYIINSKQYEDIIQSIYDGNNEIIDVFKSKEGSNLEKLVLNIQNGVRDKSKNNSNEKSIKVKKYKSNKDKRFFVYSYPKEINIIEEIN